jgi:hypothetical protein
MKITTETRVLTPALRCSGVSKKLCPALFAHESEDAHLTGSTRSLFRRLLALNFPGGVSAWINLRTGLAG